MGPDALIHTAPIKTYKVEEKTHDPLDEVLKRMYETMARR